jgi:hypothetical protein
MARASGGDSGTVSDADVSLFTYLNSLLIADKTVDTPVSWVEDDQGNFRFSRPLDVEGVTEQGFTLFGRAVAILPGQNVTLGLRWSDGLGRDGNFDRLDWKPKDAHNNRGLGPPNLRHVLIEGSHHHSLSENAGIGLTRALAENLPVAVPLEPEPAWPDFLSLVALRWKIPTLVHMPEPPWQNDLLTFSNRGRVGR